MKTVIRVLLAASALVAVAAAAPAGNDPSGVVLLVNGEHPDSAAVADHYAAARHIPPKQVLRLRVPLEGNLDLAAYRASLEEPLRDFLLRGNLEERARCIVLSRGFPVRVFTGGGWVSTAALIQCMDLPFSGAPQSGIPGTPLDSIPAEERANPFRSGPFPEDRRPGGRPLRLVTALDGWTAADAMALVDRSVEADAGPPADPLFVFQDARGGAQGRNAAYPEAAGSLRRTGFRVETLPVGKDEVKGRKDLLGWMSGGAYSALDDAGVLSNGFAPGAVVDMLESFGAVPGNFEEKGKRTQYPVPAMVRAGAAGVHGAVAEPYAHTFPDARLFERYTSGLDLAESFHGSLPYLYWMNLVLGDPLCAPFALRPTVEMEGLPRRVTASGPVTVRVAAKTRPGGEAPVALALFVDGEPAGTAEGSEAEFDLDLAAGADGPRTVLAVARTAGPTRTRGWTAAAVEVAVATPRLVASRPGRDALAVEPGAPLEAVWAGEPTETPELLLLDAAGDPVEGAAAVDGAARRAVFTPAAPLTPGATYSLLLRGADEGGGVPFTTGAASLEVEGPDEVVAGEEVVLAVSAAGAGPDSRALSGERMEAWLSNPPVLAAALDLPGRAEGPASFRLRPTRAGALEVRLLGRRSRAGGRHALLVKPAAASRLFLRMGPTTPVGEPFDIAVEVRDPFGNAVPDWTGTISLGSPDDPLAELPGPVAVGPGDRGRARFAGVRFGSPGIRILAASADGGLEGTDNTKVEATTIRRWLTAGPFDAGGKDPLVAPLFPGADGRRRPAPGAMLGDRAWRAERAKKPALDPGRGKGVLYAVAYLSFVDGAEVFLHLGHGGPMKAWLNGKGVYEGAAAPKAAVERGKVAVKVPKGPAALVLRLEVRGGGQDGFAARFARPDGTPVPGLRVLSLRPFPPDVLSISGTVRDGKGGPLSGVEVRLSGRGKGKTVTDARGWYGFGGLRAGTYRVRPLIPGGTARPGSRSVEVREAEATTVDFSSK